ncbi:MAG: FAD-dependent oxidoreductase [Rikenellaceae bacterium]
MNKKVIVVGGGVAGMYAALTLKRSGVEALIIEKTETLGGKLNRWDRLFPTMTPASELSSKVLSEIQESGVDVLNNTSVSSVDDNGQGVVLDNGEHLSCDGVILASGFELFDARLKEEYGYSIYDNVITSAELEDMFRTNGRVEKADGSVPKKVAFLHCVGSRDEKVKQSHCSKVCCITGVKQAIEIKKSLPDCEVFNFYMDIRMFGPGYEEMYRSAQQDYNIHLIRGRISEASATMGGKVQIKAEDTLVARPLKMDVDLLVLMVGMCAGKSNAQWAQNKDIDLAPSGFVASANFFDGNVSSKAPNIFYAGAVSAPKNIGECINDGIAAATRMAHQLKKA